MFARTTDPGESYNLAQNMPEVTGKMEGIMKNWERRMAVNPAGIVQ